MKNYLFTVKWQGGSINSAIIKVLRRHGIKYIYNHFGELYADIYKDGIYCHFDYEQISGDIFGIFEKV